MNYTNRLTAALALVLVVCVIADAAQATTIDIAADLHSRGLFEERSLRWKEPSVTTIGLPAQNLVFNVLDSGFSDEHRDLGSSHVATPSELSARRSFDPGRHRPDLDVLEYQLARWQVDERPAGLGGSTLDASRIELRFVNNAYTTLLEALRRYPNELRPIAAENWLRDLFFNRLGKLQLVVHVPGRIGGWALDGDSISAARWENNSGLDPAPATPSPEASTLLLFGLGLLLVALAHLMMSSRALAP